MPVSVPPSCECSRALTADLVREVILHVEVLRRLHPRLALDDAVVHRERLLCDAVELVPETPFNYSLTCYKALEI